MKLFVLFLMMIAAQTGLAQTVKRADPQNTATQPDYVRPDSKERFRKYLNSAFGPTALIGPVFSSTFKQIRNRPEEWEKTGKGFAKRFGDSIARNAINHTITYGLDEALKVDSNFYKSKKKNFGARFSNAVVSAFTARREDGKRVIGIPRIVGTYSAAIIANETWMPNRFTYRDGLRDGTISLGTRVGLNLMREFIRR